MEKKKKKKRMSAAGRESSMPKEGCKVARRGEGRAARNFSHSTGQERARETGQDASESGGEEQEDPLAPPLGPDRQGRDAARYEEGAYPLRTGKGS
jgi:hypothetical protein